MHNLCYITTTKNAYFRVEWNKWWVELKNQKQILLRFEVRKWFRQLPPIQVHLSGLHGPSFKGFWFEFRLNYLVTYRFVDFNVGGAFDKSYFTAPFRGIYAFSAQIGTKKRVNTYIFMKVIIFLANWKPWTSELIYAMETPWWSHRREWFREIRIKLIIEKKCERKQDFLVLRRRWTTWCISQRSEFISTWCGWQGQCPDINFRKGHVNYILEIINDHG